ncbi:MAG TPA: hypothetical protein DCM05_12670 [Elusimicrobia bacterium]|nr:hypothetical protein [Elusimicrobiota bacterium]
MGILRSREELIPVTCAVLSDEHRRNFFEKIQKRAGRLERIAHAAGTVAAVVSDWISGRTLVPYHALQRLAQEFGIEAPPVSELRREFQVVAHTPPPKAPPPPPAPAKREAKPERSERGRRTRQPRRQEPRKREKPAPQQPKARQPRKPQPPRQAKPQPKQGPKPVLGGPVKYSERLAYWTGVFFAAGKLEGEELRLHADRRMGQNFAGAWARLSETLFGTKPVLSMTEDRKEQIAAFPSKDTGDFLAKLDLKSGGEAPQAPRWVWSNPEWKTSFIKGVADASAHFHRTPSLKLLGLSEALRKSAQKILASMKFEPKLLEDQSLALEGPEQVEKFFSAIGTDNFKLRDQFSAYQRSKSENPGPEAEDAGETQEPEKEDASDDAPIELGTVEPQLPDAEPSADDAD